MCGSYCSCVCGRDTFVEFTNVYAYYYDQLLRVFVRAYTIVLQYILAGAWTCRLDYQLTACRLLILLHCDVIANYVN